MFKLTVLALCSFLLISCFPKDKTVISKDDVEQILSDWKKAMQNKDTDLLESILDDDFIYSGSKDGKRTNKMQMINNLKNDKSTMLKPEYYDIAIKFFEDVAIVRAKETLKFISDKNDTIVVKLSFTDVYQKRNGEVRTISTHSSPLDN